MTDPKPLTPGDIRFLESLAHRLSYALYYDKVGPIGTNGSVSPGLLNDDYDRLRKMATAAKIAEWDRLNLGQPAADPDPR